MVRHIENRAERIIETLEKMRVHASASAVHAGRFDREMTRERWSGGDPIAAIQADYDAGLFASDPALLELAWAVFEGH